MDWINPGLCLTDKFISRDPNRPYQYERDHGSGGEIAGSSSGIKVGGENIILHGITIEGNTTGIKIANTAYNLVIRDCYFESNHTAAIDLTSGTTRGIHVTGCFFTGKSGYSICGIAGVEWLVYGNTFTGTVTKHISMGAGVDRFHLDPNYFNTAFNASTDYARKNLFRFD